MNIKSTVTRHRSSHPFSVWTFAVYINYGSIHEKMIWGSYHTSWDRAFYAFEEAMRLNSFVRSSIAEYLA